MKCFLLMVVLFFWFSGIATAQHKINFVDQAISVKRMMEKYHYAPPAFDNSFSEKVFDAFIDRLDGNHLLFLQTDIDSLSFYRTRLDDELNGKSTKFINYVSSLYKKRLLKYDSVVTQILKKPFNFTIKETIVYPPDSSAFAKTETELYGKLQKWLKYDMLYRLMNKKVNDSLATSETIMKQEPKVREIIKKVKQRKINGILNYNSGYETYLNTLFCNAIANCYDPHSEFFPKTEKENFMGAVNNNSYSFGLELDENEKGEIVVVKVIPGSAAWKNNEIREGDVIVRVQWENKEPVDLEGADVEEIEEILSRENHDKLKITVRKSDSFEKPVELIKTKLLVDENFVKGYYLKGEKTIGYISLPSFYGEWEDEQKTSCSADVAKEVIKLSKSRIEKMEGLILDMRNNGGGSLQEALDMAGIFIDEGTLAFTKERSNKPMAMKDMNRGTIYDGPLLIMVNGSSASATELLSGALQDYNRAIIVGSNTFGKATAQVILPIDTFVDFLTAKQNTRIDTSMGYIKVTIEKLYRSTGKTNQFNGVKPDILIPNIMDEFNFGESKMPNAIRPDTIKAALYYKPLAEIPKGSLVEKSAMRLKSDKGFLTVNKLSTFIASQYLRKVNLPLEWKDYEAYVNKYTDLFKEYKSNVEENKTKLYIVENSEFDKPILEADTYKSEINKTLVNNINKDIYISESFNIMTDYIELIKK